jgi:hypothetical protein
MGGAIGAGGTFDRLLRTFARSIPGPMIGPVKRRCRRYICFPSNSDQTAVIAIGQRGATERRTTLATERLALLVKRLQFGAGAEQLGAILD